MNFNAGESKSTTNDVRELTEVELQAVAGGWAGYGAYIAKEQLQRDYNKSLTPSEYADPYGPAY
jgi:hypothetical protein